MNPVCENGLFIKAGGEQTLRPLRVIVYMLGLGWSFLGVAIIADIFMAAIEKITSRKRRKWVASKNKHVTVMVWNPTVANLTLMALGSSAPEILLNCIEIVADDYFLGGLGPSTIVGSAAFNLFVIIGVCIVSIPKGEVRAIKETNVYWLTAFVSLFAYVWLIIIVVLSSRYVIEVWEGVLTFIFFPLLVTSAWVVERRFFRGDEDDANKPQGVDLTKEELAELEVQILKEHGPNLKPEQIAKFVQIMCGSQRSRAQYRIAATRGMTGGKRVRMQSQGFGARASLSMKHLMGGLSQSLNKKVVPAWSPDDARENGREDGTAAVDDKALVEFPIEKHAVLENAGSVTVKVTRSGALDFPASVEYRTREGTAKATTDYMHKEGTLTFRPGETEQFITVQIIDDATYEEDEEFYIELCEKVGDIEEAEVRLGRATLTVFIVDDDMPGTIAFPEDERRIEEPEQDLEVSFEVGRSNGSSGRIVCKYATEDVTAIAGTDYEDVEGELVFESTQMSAAIKVKIKAVGRYERESQFRLILTWPEDDSLRGGAMFNAETDGGRDACILTVFIVGRQGMQERVDKVQRILDRALERSRVGTNHWTEQFKEAVFVRGGEEDDDPPTLSDWVMHVISSPWKLLFAFCPPTSICGGWLTFVCSLIFIGLVTALISDLANLLGCSMGICDSVTAITFVALGTSLPDTFASKTAAEQDPTADASIVNVTGSNSVNVFLGLGLPWMAASIKWKLSGATAKWDALYGSDESIHASFRFGDEAAFIVKDDSLATSVLIFAVLATVCIALLAVRRFCYGGELGGPTGTKWLSGALLVALWITYVAASASQAVC